MLCADSPSGLRELSRIQVPAKALNLCGRRAELACVGGAFIDDVAFVLSDNRTRLHLLLLPWRARDPPAPSIPRAPPPAAAAVLRLVPASNTEQLCLRSAREERDSCWRVRVCALRRECSWWHRHHKRRSVVRIASRARRLRGDSAMTAASCSTQSRRQSRQHLRPFCLH